MKKEHSLLAQPYMFYLAASLVFIAPCALAQESKAVKPEVALTGSTANAPSPDSPAGTQSPGAASQQPQEEMLAEEDEFSYEPLQIGDATQGLLAWQRSGEIASATPHPIAGAVANRSYERYLKSFEFPIPERMTSSVKSTSGSPGK